MKMLLSLALALACLVAPAAAQKVHRIGILGIDADMQGARFASVREELQKLGYVEGRNIAFEYRWAQGQFDRLDALAAELAAGKVDIVLTAAPRAVAAAKSATSTIPIVVAATHEAVAMGVVASASHPAGNITGVSFQDSELSTKRLQLLREAVPNLTRVAVLWEPRSGGPFGVKAVEDAAKAAGLEVRVFEVREPQKIAESVAAAKASGAQAVLQLASPFFSKNRKLLMEQLALHKLPAACELRMFVVEGCLMTYSASIDAMFLRSAYYIDRIIRGAKPAELPMEQPREFELVINRKTAQALGLALSPTLLYQATEVVQ